MFRHSGKLRRAFASLLLIVYGTVGIAGYGLHELSHVHHHHAQLDVQSHGESNCCPHHHHGETQALANRACSHEHGMVSNERTAEDSVGVFVAEHDCAICAFLAQAQTPVFELAVVESVASFDYEVPVSESIAPLFVPADHLARGPPLG